MGRCVFTMWAPRPGARGPTKATPTTPAPFAALSSSADPPRCTRRRSARRGRRAVRFTDAHSHASLPLTRLSYPSARQHSADAGQRGPLRRYANTRHHCAIRRGCCAQEAKGASACRCAVAHRHCVAWEGLSVPRRRRREPASAAAPLHTRSQHSAVGEGGWPKTPEGQRSQRPVCTVTTHLPTGCSGVSRHGSARQ